MPNERFAHDSHLRMLDNAAQFLRLHDADGLAGAVERARMLHVEMMTRHASATRIRNDLQRLMTRADSIARDLDNYVLRASGPWIGCELWNKPGEEHGDDTETGGAAQESPGTNSGGEQG